MRVVKERIQERLEVLYQCGWQPDGTHSRVAFSEEDREARERFAGYFRKLGLHPRQDMAGNLVIRLEGREKDAPAIIVGSHMDTVLDGGKFDGVYGCVAGLEVVEALLESGRKLDHPLEVIVFADEEGIRFGNGMFGSRAFCQEMTGEILLDERDIYGRTRAEVSEDFGMDLSRIAEAVRRRESVHCTLELHVEQGRRLEHAGLSLGVVTSIAGVKRFEVTVTGEANHSGSTRMEDRADPLVAAAAAVSELPRIVRQTGEAFTVGTVGNLTVSPGAVNTIPGRCGFLLEVRDQREEVMARVVEAFWRELQRDCQENGTSFSIRELDAHSPGKMNETVQGAIRQACESSGYSYMELPSGAFHDSLLLARRFPAGMIFVPSNKGISHSPMEDTSLTDLEKGARILLETILILDQEEGIEDETV